MGEPDPERHPSRGPDAEKEASTPTAASTASAELEQPPRTYLTGWSYYLVAIALSLALFLVNLETTIVATSLVSIANDLHSFQRVSWVVTAYLLTYTGLLIISAKLSDLYGRKSCVLFFLALFTIFSGVCGAAQTMTQLIILRAMQGIGAAGSNAVARVIFFELVPPAKYAATSSVVALVYALCFLVGPLMGGAISEHGAWRWIFLLNAPAGAVTILLLFIALPNNFPHHDQPKDDGDKLQPRSWVHAFFRGKLERIDFVGAATLLAASVLLVAALEEANTEYPWNSAAVICMLVFSGVSWIAFFMWSWWRSRRPDSPLEPVFPWHFLRNRFSLSMLLLSFVSGAPITICIISFPLRFQSVNGSSPIAAGVHLLPYAVLVPVGAALCSGLMGKPKIPPIHLTFFGAALQVIGSALIGFTSPTTQLTSSFYGYSALIGLGNGFVYNTITVAMQCMVDMRDTAVANSATVQLRLLGGVVGLSIVTAVFNSYVRSHLSDVLDEGTLQMLLTSIESVRDLPGPVKDTVRLTFAAAYNIQLQINMAFGAAQIPIAFLMWKKPQIRV